MCYLAANKIIHRDVALRNLLVRAENDEKYFVKVTISYLDGLEQKF
jgi:tRNA A-37 threonylcarbamoyl transferase component Bud32